MPNTDFNFGHSEKEVQQFSLDFSRTFPVSAQIGMKQADDNANERWKDLFDKCLFIVARRQAELTSDDVLAEMATLPNPPKTHNLSAIGAAMLRAERKGTLEHTDRVKRSERPEKHGNRQNVWRSKEWKPQSPRSDR